MGLGIDNSDQVGPGILDFPARRNREKSISPVKKGKYKKKLSGGNK